MQQIIHYFLHLVFPVFIARWYDKAHWPKAYAILLLTMLVDIDHLLADPIYDSCRCSVGFHPLHSYWVIALYVIGLFFSRTRLVAIGLLLHIATDGLDCLMSSSGC